MNNKNTRYLWLAIAVFLLFFVGGKWNFPLAAWLAPVFAIRFFRDSDKAGRNFLLMWVVTTLPTIISWNGATAMHSIHPIVEPIFFLLTAPLALLPYVIDRMYARRFGASAWLTLVYPIAATAMDFFSANGSPFGTFGAGAYSQRDFLAIMQVASVTGLWGITFIVSWFASIVNYVWENGLKIDRFALTFACSLTLILGLGFGRTLLKPQPAQTPVIAGFSLPNETLSSTIGQFNSEDEAGFRQTVDKLNAGQLNQIRTLANDGANIVSLQEGAIMGMTDQIEKVISDAGALAKAENIYIILPTFDLQRSPAENNVHIIDPHGDVVLTHTKYGGNMFEGTLKGNEILQTVDTPYGKLSAIICWDADFPNIVKQAGAQNVDLMFVPSNDWMQVKDIHAGMATFRAVENGMSIFRQVGQGVSSVTDAYGREINRVDMFAEENTTGFTNIQTVPTPVGTVNTLYPAVGDMFGNMALLGMVGLVIGLFLTNRRKRSLA